MVDEVLYVVFVALYGVLGGCACILLGRGLAWLGWRLLLQLFGRAERGLLLRVTRFGTFAIGYDVVYVTVLLPDSERVVQASAGIPDIECADAGDRATVLLFPATVTRWLPRGVRSRVVLLEP